MTHPTELSTQHGFAYKESGQFAGWPANGGIWQWGDEILVRFQIGTHIENSGKGHAIARDKPSRQILARSRDGGENIEFVSWMTHNIEVRSVMPSTVRISETHLVTALRRRYDTKQPDGTRLSSNWIEISHSTDDGETWEFISKAADTDGGDGRNGNPPSMVRLKDNRLCVTYGYRGVPYGVRAKFSEDNGKSWGDEIHLRDDGRNWDLGYTRTIQRTDGKLVTLYYYTTLENPEQHIASMIWTVDES